MTVEKKYNHSIGKEGSVYFIAEAGKNFIQTQEDQSVENYLDNAKKLAKAAKDAGADAVKFQTHNLEDEFLKVDIVSPHFVGSDRYNWIKRNQRATPLEFWQELKRYCDEIGITFFSTPMSRGAAMILDKVGVPMWKVGSGDILDFVMLDYLAATGKPVIISSGMSSLDEVDLAVEFLKKRTDKIALLHCVSKYPCPPEELNLSTIELFKERYGIQVGFSDHSVLDYQSVLAAVELGATIIEKHFSFSRELWGSDHKASLMPDEFKAMVEAVKKGEKTKISSFGSKEKKLYDDEAVFRPIFRKSLMAGSDIKASQVIEKDMVYAMRPQKYAGGLPSEKYDKVIGHKAKRDLKKFDPITTDDLL